MMTMRATWTAAFEPRTTAGTAAPAIIGSTTSTVVASAIVAIAPAAAVRPLETGPRIASDARGIAREILARLGSAGARCAGLAGQKNAVVLCSRRCRRKFSACGLDGFAASLFVDFRVADSSRMQRTFVRGICFRFAERMGIKSACLDSLDLFSAYILRLDCRFAGVNLFVLFGMILGVGFFLFFFLLLFLLFRLFEGSAAHECVGCGVRLRFFVLSFDQAGRDYGYVFFAKRSVIARGFLLDSVRFRSGGQRLRFRDCSVRGTARFC